MSASNKTPRRKRRTAAVKTERIKERDTKRPPTAVTRKKYLTLRNDYVQFQSISHAAKAAGVGQQTARRYIFEGRPDKNMPPIIDFVKKTAAKDESKLEFTLDEQRRKAMREVREALNGCVVELRLHNRRIQIEAQKAQQDPEYVPQVDSRWYDLMRGYDIGTRLMERMLGAADETVNVTGSGNIVSKMTTKEAMEYLKTAVIPERLR